MNAAMMMKKMTFQGGLGDCDYSRASLGAKFFSTQLVDIVLKYRSDALQGHGGHVKHRTALTRLLHHHAVLLLLGKRSLLLFPRRHGFETRSGRRELRTQQPLIKLVGRQSRGEHVGGHAL